MYSIKLFVVYFICVMIGYKVLLYKDSFPHHRHFNKKLFQSERRSFCGSKASQIQSCWHCLPYSISLRLRPSIRQLKNHQHWYSSL
jgi:hypothetical protein